MLVRTRFAPSPTGELHLGGLRTALYAYLWARHHGSAGSFYVRIEDTDRERFVPGSADRMLAQLKELGISWDDGPYVQSERLATYREVAQRLVEQGSAYRCVCTPERLRELRESQTAARQPTRYDGRCRARTDIAADVPHVVRFRTPEEGSVTTEDLLRGPVVVPAAALDDFVLMKSGGYPTYHLAHVVDDHHDRTTHVIRGDEWLPSLPKHLLLFRALTWDPPTYAHLPLLLNAQHKKLSKRDGDMSIASFLMWCLPEALGNFVALLGWNPGGNQELYTRDALIAAFDLTRVHTAPAIVDLTKLTWMNSAYLRSRSPSEVLPYVLRVLPPDAGGDREFLIRAIALEQPRMKRLDAFPAWYVLPYRAEALLTWKGTDRITTRNRLRDLHAYLTALDPACWPTARTDIPEFEQRVKAWMDARGHAVGETLWPMRVALSGQTASPGPFELAWCFGRTVTLQRIHDAVTSLT